MEIITVGTRNKEQVGKQRIVPYFEFFPYCESISFKTLNLAKHQHFVIANFNIIAESLIANSTSTLNFKPGEVKRLK